MQPASNLLTARIAGLTRALGHAARSSRVRLFFFGCLALATSWVSLRHAGQMNLYRDAQVLTAYEDAARKTVVDFGQLPLWNPYYCGGVYGLGSPQARFAAPPFLLTLLFGTLRAEPLVAFAMTLGGLEGAFRYARARGATSLGAGLGAPIFALSGHFAFSAALGWTNFFGFQLLPWMLLGFRGAARGSMRGVALAAVTSGFVVGFGGTYAAPMAVPLVAFEIASTLAERKPSVLRVARGLGGAFVASALALGVSAFRLWPVAETLARAPRVIGGAPGLEVRRTLGALLRPLAAPNGGDFESANGTFYIGAFVVVALVAGIVRWRSWSLVVTAYLTIWVAIGYAIEPSLFGLMRRVPLYDSLRYPERFLIPFALYVAVLSAIGISRLFVLSRTTPRVGAPLFVLASIAMLAGLVPMIRNHHVATAARTMAPAPQRVSREFHQARGNRWVAAYYPAMSRGSLSCWDAYPVPQSPLLRGDLVEEAYPTDPTAGTARIAAWTPNRLEIDVDLKVAARVAVNQNAHPGWRVSTGSVTNERGLLAIDLPAGKQRVTLRFLPRSAVLGALTSALALAILAFLVRRERVRGTPSDTRSVAQRLGLSLLPGLLVPLGIALWREPPSGAFELKTPAGEELITNAPPEGATPSRIVFDGGMELVAVRVSDVSPTAGSTITLELDWRARAPVTPGMGVWMRLETPGVGGTKEEVLNGDHPRLSGLVDLDYAARVSKGKILRDVVELSVPHDGAGKTWKVWAGLWMLKGRGERVEVREQAPPHDPRALEVVDHRVLVATLTVR